MLILALLLLASSQHLEVVNEHFEIPAGKWYQVGLGLQQGRPVLISADYEGDAGSLPIRLQLIRREDLGRLLEGRSGAFLAMTAPASSGRLRYMVRRRDSYVVFLDNREGTRAVAGHLRVALDFRDRPGPEVTTLPLERQVTVIVISFAVFFAIVTFSARRLLRGIRR